MVGSPKPRYSGVLNQPIVRPPGLLFSSPASRIGAQWLLREQLAKLDPLLAHYRIAPNEPEPWFKLAFALAVAHVPGMQVERPRKGRRRKWTPSYDREFFQLIDQIKRERRKGLRDAVHIAKKRRRMKESLRGLENRYYESKKRIQAHEEFVRRFPSLSELAKCPLGDTK